MFWVKTHCVPVLLKAELLWWLAMCCVCLCVGSVKVWDPRQKNEAVATMEPGEGETKRDCWTVCFGGYTPFQLKHCWGGWERGQRNVCVVVLLHAPAHYLWLLQRQLFYPFDPHPIHPSCMYMRSHVPTIKHACVHTPAHVHKYKILFSSVSVSAAHFVCKLSFV